MGDPQSVFSLAGGPVEIVLHGVDGTRAQDIMAELQAEGLRLQRTFNFFDPQSELSALNRERSIEASAELREVITLALRFCELTEGRYDITLGRQIQLLKGGEHDLPVVGCSYKNIRLEGARVTLTHPDALVDLGSIAKGYIADRIVELARALGAQSAFIDARGDARASGERARTVRLHDPHDHTRHISVELRDRAIAVSGDYVQYVRTHSNNHIIGTTDLVSVCILGPSLAEADAVSTATLVSGSNRAIRLLAQLPHLQALLITKDRREIMLNGFDATVLEGRA